MDWWSFGLGFLGGGIIGGLGTGYVVGKFFILCLQCNQCLELTIPSYCHKCCNRLVKE